MQRNALFPVRVGVLLSALALCVAIFPLGWLPFGLAQKADTLDHFCIGVALGILIVLNALLFFSREVSASFQQE
jgi:formylmethanofuran dehydrogenase subunit E-like metal-binding protein